MDGDLETALREELEAARGETAALAERLAEREAHAAQAEERSAELRRELERAREGQRVAVFRFRDAALAAAPELPGDLVAGETVEEVERAIERARAVVAHVRGHDARTPVVPSVPAGSPARRGPDTSAMSAMQKIRMGIEAVGSRQ